MGLTARLSSRIQLVGPSLGRVLALGIILLCLVATPTIASAATPMIAVGNYYSLALKSDGTVWSWGGLSGSLTPVQTNGLTGVVAVAAGGYHNLALKSDGTVWAWGNNYFGSLGNGTATDSSVPVQVSGLVGVVAVAGGASHSLALKNDGTVWAWGYNLYGQLGDGTTTNSSIPVQVSDLIGVVAIAGGAGPEHSLALKNDGTVWAWGDNRYGQLGNNTWINSSIPVQVSNLIGVVAVAGGAAHSLALKDDGSVWTWGDNYYGELGNGTTGYSYPTPAKVGGLSSVVGIATGGEHNLALKSDGTVWAWGQNTFGELGNGTTTHSPIPVQTTGMTGVIAIAGSLHSLALKNDGTVWAWGYNYYGQLGNGNLSTLPTTTPDSVSGLGRIGRLNLMVTSVTLVSGWNLLGNSFTNIFNVSSTFGDATKVTTVWKWDASKSSWAFYTPSLSDGGSAYAASKGYDFLTVINAGEGYWVNTLTSMTLPLQTGSAFNWNSINFASLPSGFNLIAHASNVTPSVFNTSISLTPPGIGVIATDNFSTLWAWDATNATWFFYSPLLESSGTLSAVKSYADSHSFQHFQDFNKKIDIGVGFWVNKF